jgi:hypothetical protein
MGIQITSPKLTHLFSSRGCPTYWQVYGANFISLDVLDLQWEKDTANLHLYWTVHSCKFSGKSPQLLLSVDEIEIRHNSQFQKPAQT